MGDANLLPNNPIDQDDLEKMRAAVGPGPVLIVTHDSPDPDALAAGMALAFLFKKAWDIDSRLMYCGLVARAENQAMLRLLATEWEYVDNFGDLSVYTGIVLVDSQPGAGNNSLPEGVLPAVVIDHHHPLRDQLDQVPYIEVRPEVGASTTLVYQYLAAAGIIPSTRLATAMFYGLQTDTRGLARGASPLDEVVYVRLLSWLDRSLLIDVEQAGLTREYFRAIHDGLAAARLHGRLLIAYLGDMLRPDMPAEMADILIRLDDAHTALCLGVHENVLYLSLRTDPMTLDAGLLVQDIIVPEGKAGGHGTMAGGQVDLAGRDRQEMVGEVVRRCLQVIGEPAESVPLIPD